LSGGGLIVPLCEWGWFNIPLCEAGGNETGIGVRRTNSVWGELC